MKLFALISLVSLFINIQSFAETKPDEHKGDGFEKHKTQTLERIDQMLKDTQDLKSCVSSSKNHDDMKKCHEDQKKHREEMEQKHKDQKKEKIDEQIKHLQEEKAKLEQQPKK